MSCQNCGGTMVGDGYTTAIHCEYVDLPAGREADAPPLYCTEIERESNGDKNQAQEN